MVKSYALGKRFYKRDSILDYTLKDYTLYTTITFKALCYHTIVMDDRPVWKLATVVWVAGHTVGSQHLALVAWRGGHYVLH